MIEIKEGPELNQAVAEAIGLVATHLTLDGRAWHVDPRFGTKAIPVEFCPSTDLNDAFAAAEIVGVFRRYAYCGAPGRHVLSETVPVASWDDVIVHEDTPALALCAAVLEVAKQQA